MHGGKSTGPKTLEGIGRISRAARKRWDEYRAKKPRLLKGEVSQRQEQRIAKIVKQAETQRRLAHRVDVINALIEQRGVAGIREADVDELMAEIEAQVPERCRADKALLAKLPNDLRRELEKEAALAPLQRKVRALMDQKGLLICAEAAVSRIPLDRIRRFERHALKQTENERGRELRARLERPTSYLKGSRTRAAGRKAQPMS